VHVAHNTVIGANCRVVAGAVICGSCQIGDEVWVGPNAVISHGLTVGDGAYVCLGSIVVSNVPAGQKVSGNFAVEHAKNSQHWTKLRLGLS
jgi:UDP-3-O-[3-hydroxymyristoyl] glucosamine N-acyltransferase